MSSYKQQMLRGAVTGAIVGGAVLVMGLCVINGLNKEAKRKDVVRQYNCAHYGQAINKHAGSEVCPPTPQG